MLLDEVALMLAGEVCPPIDGKLELAPSLHRRLEDLDPLRIGHTLEGLLQHEA